MLLNLSLEFSGRPNLWPSHALERIEVVFAVFKPLGLVRSFVHGLRRLGAPNGMSIEREAIERV